MHNANDSARLFLFQLKVTMKKITQPSLILFAFLILLIASCRKDSSLITDTPIFPNPTILIETGAKGMVADEDGKAIEGATVRLGQEVTTTNAYGYFEISGKTNADQPFVKIEKAGYFPSICNFTGRAGEYGRLKSILRTKTLSGRIQAANGGGIQVSGGGSIEFKAGGFVNSAGQAYNGDVNVYATYLDPSKPETMQMIPGSFRGTSLEGEDQVLVSYGMMNVLLESPSGEKLQINKPATLNTPIPASKLSSAPSSIPLWYINEATSIWMEEGSATKQGNSYVGEVSHFSWWNVDIGFPVVNLSGRVIIDGSYPFVILQITRSNSQITTSVPNSEGYFSGGVVANESFLFEVINECGIAIYSANLGPYSSDTDLGNLFLGSGSSWSTISGTLENCDGEPVTNGIVFFSSSISAPVLFPIEADPIHGTFMGVVPTCETDFTLTGYDLDNLTASSPITGPASPVHNFGVISVCNSLAVGLSFEYDGQSKFIPNAFLQYTDSTLYTHYNFTFNENQAGKSVAYHISIINHILPPAAPDWKIYSGISTSSGTVYFTGFATGQINFLQAGTKTGEYVHIQLTGITLIRHPDQTTFTNVKANVIAKIP